MGTVLGPFDKDDFYTMQQLKLDLAYNRKKFKGKPEFEIVEKTVKSKLESYLTRVAA